MVLVASQWPCIGRDDERARIVALLRAGHSVLVAAPAGVGRSRLALECVRRLDGADTPAVTLVEDVHLLAESDAEALHARCGDPDRPLLLTLCTDENAPKPVIMLWAHSLVERVDLVPLTGEAIKALLAVVLEGQVDEAIPARLLARCAGNLLYLRELVLGGVEVGTIFDDAGIWRARREWPLPQRLLELVGSRLDGLPRDELASLELVAYAGIAGSAEVETLTDAASVECLERRKLVRTTLNRRRLEVSVAHPLLAEVVIARTPVIRRRTLARQLAQLVESTGCRRHDDLLRVATWRLSGGGGSARLLLDGAHAARSAYDLPLAERLARAALEEGAGFPAELLTAKLIGLQGRDIECQQALQELADNAHTEGERTAVENALGEQQAIWMGALGLDEGDSGAAQTESDPPRRHELRVRRAGALLLTDGPRAAVTEATGLLCDPNDRVRTWAAIVLGYSLARTAHCRQALDVAVAGHASHRSLEWLTGWERWWHDFNRTEALLQAGRLADAHTLALDNYEQALGSQAMEKQALFGWQLSKINYERGRLATAARQGKVCTSLFRALGRTAYIRVAQVSAALALARAGHATEAAKTLAEVERVELRIPAIAVVDLWRARAWCAAAGGAIAEGRSHLAEAIKIGADTGDVMGESAALHDLVRLGGAGDAHTRLAYLDEDSESALVTARSAHAHATCGGDPEVLADASTRFTAIGAQLTAAEAAADAAVRWRRDGDVRRAAAAEQRAHTILADCEGCQAFGVETLGARSVLSPGEHETAAIAAAGRSNREIAAQLQLSQRTVENRLQRVYDKLGVRGREDLSDALGLTPAGSN